VWYGWALRELNLAPLDVIGFSTGGWTAAEMASVNAKQFRKMMLVAPAGIKPPEGEIMDLFSVTARTSLNASIYNDQNQSIGSIDDLLMSDNDHKAGTAVLSVGGFLGMGTRLVVVPYDTLKFVDQKVILPGGTKEGLKMLPEFKYATG